MSDNTKIEWTDATINAVNGCSVVSPGCKHCYAMKQAHRFDVRRGLTTKTAGGMVWTGEVRFNEKALLQPLAWKRARRIFWNAHGDLFHDSVPDEWIDKVFAVCALTPQHSHQILTKRSARMREYLTARKQGAPRSVAIGDGTTTLHPWNNELKPPVNVWLGVSVEDQQRADERIPDLLATPAAVRFLSCEPLLGPVNLSKITLRREGCLPTDLSNRLGDYVQPLTGNFRDSPKIAWVIIGGESGPKARPMHPDWARSLRDQCAAAGVPMLFKQWGEWEPRAWKADGGTHAMHCLRASSFQKINHHPDSLERTSVEPEWQAFANVGKKAAGRLLDSVQHDGMPNQISPASQVEMHSLESGK